MFQSINSSVDKTASGFPHLLFELNIFLLPDMDIPLFSMLLLLKQFIVLIKKKKKPKLSTYIESPVLLSIRYVEWAVRFDYGTSAQIFIHTLHNMVTTLK